METLFWLFIAVVAIGFGVIRHELHEMRKLLEEEVEQ